MITTRDNEEVLATGKAQEMCVRTVFFGVFNICDWWIRIEEDPTKMEAIVKCLVLTNVS